MGSWPNVINLVQSRNVWHVTFVLKCHTQFALHHSTTNHHQHQHINMSSNASITPKQISCRATDYDSQIREGLEDGSIRQVVKRLGSDLVSQKKKSFSISCMTSSSPRSNFCPFARRVRQNKRLRSRSLCFCFNLLGLGTDSTTTRTSSTKCWRTLNESMRLRQRQPLRRFPFGGKLRLTMNPLLPKQ